MTLNFSYLREGCICSIHQRPFIVSSQGSTAWCSESERPLGFPASSLQTHTPSRVTSSHRSSSLQGPPWPVTAFPTEWLESYQNNHLLSICFKAAITSVNITSQTALIRQVPQQDAVIPPLFAKPAWISASLLVPWSQASHSREGPLVLQFGSLLTENSQGSIHNKILY